MVQLSGKKFFAGCCGAAAMIFLLGAQLPIGPEWVALEVVLAVIALFVFGSIRWRLDKNAITYGAVLIIFATFWHLWWPDSDLRLRYDTVGWKAWIPYLQHYLLTLGGLDQLIHADTMLFILGLTLFVAAIAQTRLLESLSFAVLNKTGGSVVTTVAILAAIVAFASGILDGVSMIGLMIRILVLILFLAKAKDEAVLYAVMVSTVVTTVCGMWMAYGEPPNLIMKANLAPHLDNAFFLRYCLPAAVGSYFIVLFNVRKRLRGHRIDVAQLDVLDRYTADVRFFQALRHGEVLIAVEWVDQHRQDLGDKYAEIERRLHYGEPLGSAMIAESVPAELREKILGAFVAEEVAVDLDRHYQAFSRAEPRPDSALQRIHDGLANVRRRRIAAQRIGALAFLPFIGLLVWHAIDHSVPLFYASFAGALIAFLGILKFRSITRLAFREAKHEYGEYLFLLPLFFSLALLQKTGFFEIVADLLKTGTERWGASWMAYLQFSGTSVLSAILDNNVVADFGGRAIRGFELGVLYLFSMAQIAGYATGGCWTHIGSAQSVVAYSFIRRELDPAMTPFGWIKAMTPIIIEVFLLMTVIIYGETLLLKYFPAH